MHFGFSYNIPIFGHDVGHLFPFDYMKSIKVVEFLF